MKHRFLEFDLLRSVAVVWIVAIWHFTNYCAPDSIIRISIAQNSVCREFTIIMLSLFMFMSGLFTKTTNENFLKTTKAYYLQKFWRFYPLYLIAAISLYIISKYMNGMVFYSGSKSFYLSLFGLATLSDLAPATLWFMDLLLFFILITPLSFISSNKKWILVFSIYCILTLCWKCNMVDYRILMYMPFYFLGIYLTPEKFLDYCGKYGIWFMVLGVVIALIPIDSLIISLLSRLCFVIGVGKLANIFVKHCKNKRVWAFLNVISYSSMCAYFFHRQIYAFGLKLSIPLFLLPFLIFVISFFIQKAYDLLHLKKSTR